MFALFVSTAAFQVPAAPRASTVMRGDFEDLRDWVRAAGGSVCEELALQDGPSGCRGLVAKEHASLEAVTSKPLIVIPHSLEMNGVRARKEINKRLPTEARSLLGLDDGALCVLWLAREVSHMADSEWEPYLRSLPDELSNGWALANPDVYLKEVFGDTIDLGAWLKATDEGAKYVDKVSSGLHKDYGGFLGISKDALVWALGMVSSRSMGGEKGARLVPLLDLVNHNETAAPFTSFNALEYNDVERSSRSVEERRDAARRVEGDDWSLWSFDSDNQTPRPLRPGDELLANYFCPEDYSPFDWWLNAGFIPIEHRP